MVLLSLGQFSGSLTFSHKTGYEVEQSGNVGEFLAAADEIAVAEASVEDFIRGLGPEAYAFIHNEEDDIAWLLSSTWASRSSSVAGARRATAESRMAPAPVG